MPRQETAHEARVRRAGMNLASLSVRDATLADLPRIVEIYNETIPGKMLTADLEPVIVELGFIFSHNR